MAVTCLFSVVLLWNWNLTKIQITSQNIRKCQQREDSADRFTKFVSGSMAAMNGDGNRLQFISDLWFANWSSSNSFRFLEIHWELGFHAFSFTFLILVFLVFIKLCGFIFKLIRGFPDWWFLMIKLLFIMESCGFITSCQNVKCN